MRLSLMLVFAGLTGACSSNYAAPPTSPAPATSTASCAPSVTLSASSFTEVGGQATLSILTPRWDCAWSATLPDWILPNAPTSGTGNRDLILTVPQSDTDRTGTIVVGASVREVRQEARKRLIATCFSGRPGDRVLLACTATVETRGMVTPVGRLSADFSALGGSSEVFSISVAGNYDWGIHIPANQPVGTVTIPMRLPYGEGSVAGARPQFRVSER
jgi:hypothetical protein